MSNTLSDHRDQLIEMLMLYGCILPDHLKVPMHDRYPDSMLWQILSDVYMHYPKPLEDLLQNYGARLMELHHHSAPADFHWSVFRRVHPMLCALYGHDAVDAMRVVVPDYPYNLEKYDSVDFQDETLRDYLFRRSSSVDFLSDYRDVAFFNGCSVKDQNILLSNISKVKQHHSDGFHRNTSPKQNISRLDHCYSLPIIKDVVHLARTVIQEDMCFDHTAWLSVMRSTHNPYDRLLAHILVTRKNINKILYGIEEFIPWWMEPFATPEMTALDVMTHMIKDTPLVVCESLFHNLDDSHTMLELINIINACKSNDPLLVHQEASILL